MVEAYFMSPIKFKIGDLLILHEENHPILFEHVYMVIKSDLSHYSIRNFKWSNVYTYRHDDRVFEEKNWEHVSVDLNV